MKRTITSILLALSIVVVEAAPIAIAKNGKSGYVIALPLAATTVEKTAATELQSHLKQSIGTELPVVSENDAVGCPAIYVGATKPFQKRFGSNKLLEKMDAIALAADGSNIILGGHPDRAPLYAVYEFLERHAGVRWWTSTEALIPYNPNLTVDVAEFVYAPPLEYREVYCLDGKDEKFASHLRSNGFWTKLTPEYGGKLNVYGWCHTFEQIMPPNKFFKEHPEWFSLVDGKRVGDGAQLCLTNPEMRREFLKLTLGKIEKYPGLWQMSISQNDNHKWCECPSCKALAEREGGQCGPLLDFVNEIARGVAKVHPELPVSTLAYQKSRNVPKTIRPEDNVCIWLCSIENNYGESVEEGGYNASFKKDIEDWSKISKRLFIWNYTAFFGNFMVPHPNHANIGNDIRYFVKMKAQGIFPQGDFYCNIGDFAALRAYVMGKLLWNPDVDEKTVAMEFLNGYYGEKAAPFLMEYLEYICDAAKKSGTFVSCYRHLHSYDWFTPDVKAKCYALFKKAEDASAGNALFAERVRRERLTLDTLYLLQLPSQIRDAKRLGKPLPEYGGFLEEYATLTAKYKPTHYALSRPWGNYPQKIKNELKNAMDNVPAGFENVPGRRWIKFEDGEFFLHKVNPKDKSELWAEVIDDAAASDGSAIRMPGSHRQWAAQMGMLGYGENSKDFTVDKEGVKKKYTVSVYARAEGDSDNGDAINAGIYSHNQRKVLARFNIPLKDAKGMEYKRFVFPPLELDNDISLFIAPPCRPAAELKYIFVDKIVMELEE